MRWEHVYTWGMYQEVNILNEAEEEQITCQFIPMSICQENNTTFDRLPFVLLGSYRFKYCQELVEWKKFFLQQREAQIHAVAWIEKR